MSAAGDLRALVRLVAAVEAGRTPELADTGLAPRLADRIAADLAAVAEGPRALTAEGLSGLVLWLALAGAEEAEGRADSVPVRRARRHALAECLAGRADLVRALHAIPGAEIDRLRRESLSDAMFRALRREGLIEDHEVLVTRRLGPVGADRAVALGAAGLAVAPVLAAATVDAAWPVLAATAALAAVYGYAATGALSRLSLRPGVRWVLTLRGDRVMRLAEVPLGRLERGLRARRDRPVLSS